MDARSRLQALLVVVVALLALPARGQSAPAASAPAAATAPSTAPAATRPSAPVAAAQASGESAGADLAPAEKHEQASNIRFQFDKESYRDVVRFIARCADKPILGDLTALNGQLTYFDARPYTYDEALGLVNQVLRSNNFTLMDGGRYIKLLPLAQVPQQSNLPLISGEDLAERTSQDEIVTAILPLTHVEPGQAVAVIARLVHSYGTLAQLEGGRGLIITDSLDNIRRIRSLLKEIDKGEASMQQLRYYKLKTASADSTAKLIDQLFGSGQKAAPAAVAARRGGQPPAPNQPAPAPVPVLSADTRDVVTVAADARSNTVVVMASPDKHQMIEELLAQVDTEQTTGEGGIRVLALKKQKAVELAKTMMATFGPGAKSIQTGVDPQGRPIFQQVASARIVADEATNRLILSGPPDVLKQAEQMVTELDEAAVEASGLRIIPLKVASAANLVQVVQNTFGPQRGQGQRPPGSSSNFSVVADTRTNCLIVNGSAAETEAVSALVEQLDKSDESRQEIHVARLASGDAAQLADALGKMLSQRGGPGGPSNQDSVRIQADRSTNSLLIAAAPGEWKMVESVLEQLTKEAPAATLGSRVFKLKQTKAAEVAGTLQRIFDVRQRQNRPGQPAPAPVVVGFDNASNSLLVSATGDDVSEIERLLQGIDVPADEAAKTSVRSYSLSKANARELATSLARLFAADQGRRPQAGEYQPRFEAENNSNQLVVSATAQQFETIEPLLKKLQSDATESTTETKIFTCKLARAADLAPVLQSILGDASRANRRGGQGGGNGQNVPEVRIAAQEQANSLVVQGPPEAIALAEQIIQRFDSEGAAETTIQVFACTKADAISLAEAVNKALAEQGGKGPGNQAKAENATVVAEPNSNSLLIRGSKDQVAKAMDLVKKLDQGGVGAGAAVRVFPLKHAQAGLASKTIDGLFRQMINQGRRNSSVPPPVFSIAADERTNSLIVSAGPPQMAILEALLTSLDSQAETPLRDVQFIPLYRADAVELAGKINAMFLDRPKSEQPTVEADALSNGLTVVAKDADFRAISAVVEKFDEAAQSSYIQVRVIPLQPQARAEKMAEVLKRVYEQVSNSDVTITDRLPRAASQPAEPAGEPMVMGSSDVAATHPAAAADAGDKAVLAGLAATATTGPSTAPAAATRPAMTASVIVAVDKPSNSLIISAARTEMEAIEGLLYQLTSSTATIDYETKVFKIQNDPAAIAKTLNELYNPRQGLAGQGGQAGAAGAGNRRGAGRGNAPAGAAAANAGNPAGATPPTLPPQLVTLVADARTKSLIVRAQPAELEMIEPMIQQLDQAPTVLSELRVFVLKNTEAVEVADNLKAVFGLTPAAMGRTDPRTQQMIRQMISMRQGGAPGQPNLPPGVAPDASQEYENDPSAGINITSNRMTNSVIVAAPADAMKIAASLVQELDQSPAANGTVVRMFKIEHADVAEVVDALTKVFASPARSAGRRPGPAIGGAAALGGSGSAAGPAVVAGNDSARTIIVSAAQDQMEEIAKVITELDKVDTAGRTLQFVTLRNARAPELARVLTEVVKSKKRTSAAEEPPTVSGDSSSNALVLAGRKAEVDELIAMAQKLDEAAVDKAGNVHILPLKNANAAATADIVGRLYQQSAQAARQGGKSIEVPAITADTRSNALLISATEEQYKAVCELVNQIDEMSPGKDQLRLIQLKNARPEDVLKAIQTLYGSQATPTVGRPNAAGRGGSGQGNRSGGNVAGAGAARGRPMAALVGGGGGVTAMGGGAGDATVLADQRALLLNANEEDWKAIQDLVKTLDDAAANNRRQVAVIPLEKATNMKVAMALQQIFGATARSGYPEDQVTVTALEGTNSIVVTAGKEKMVEVRDLIKQLDVSDVAGEQQFKRFELKNGSAQKIVALLAQMLQPMRLARPTQPITVSADLAGNAIIVVTAAPVMAEIEKMIESLDSVPPFKTAEMAIFPLKNAEAAVLASVLSDMLTAGTDKAQTPEARALQEQIRLLQLTKGKENLPPLDLSKPIKITADPPQAGGKSGSNSLIVSSTPENLAAMAEIVTLLDNVPIAQGVKLQLVHLKNSDANTVMALLKEIFAQGKTLAGKPSTPVAGKAEPDSLTGKALTNALSITADTRTNTLVLAGTDEVLALAQLIVTDLDEKATNQFTEVRVFKLTNADATETATLLRGVFAEGAATGAGAAGGAARTGGAAASPALAGARDYVSRLSVVLGKQAKPLESEQGGTYPCLSVTAEKNANILIVAARSDMLPLVEELIKAVDIPGAGSMNALRIYALKNADAQRMQQVISGLYTGANASLIRAEDKPNITVDTRTNSLVVSSSEKTFATIDSLLTKLDGQLPIDLRDIRLVPLKNADAGVMAATLQKMMDARVQRQQSLGLKDAESLKVLVLADPRSNALIVGASAEGFKLVEELAAQLDGASPALSGQIQIIGPFTNANAGTLAATLKSLFTERYSQAKTTDVAQQKPVILADLRTNCLLVSANQDDSKILESLVAKLDAKPVNPAVELAVIALKFNDSGAIGPVIQRIFADRLKSMTAPGAQPSPQDNVSVEIDPLSNSMVISASKENLEMIRQLLAKVDVEPTADSGVLKLYPLQHADVTRVSTMLQSLLTQGLYKPGLASAANNAAAKAREKVSITADVRTNTLIVSAAKENLVIVDQILAKIDAAEGWGLEGNIQVYPLTYAESDTLSKTLQQLFDRKRQAENQAAGGQGRSLAIVIISDPRTNTLLVSGGKEDIETVSGMIKRLDVVDVARSYDFRIFYLNNASATALEPSLRQLFAERPVVPGTIKTPVTIIANAKMNALVVAADKDDMVAAENLIKRMDAAPAEGIIIKAVPIIRGDAAALAKTLQQLYDAQKPAGVASSVTFTSDDRTNTIMVSAPKIEMDNIVSEIERLSTAQVTDISEIRIYSLQHADAKELATILTDALTNKPKPMGPVSPNRQTLLQFIQQSPDGKRLMASCVKEGVMVTPVERTNALLVQAPSEAIPLLTRLIETMDLADPRSAEIKVFQLRNADATQLAKVLNDLFKLQIAAAGRQEARYSVNGQLSADPPAGGEAGGPGGATSAPAVGANFGTAEQATLTITVDPRTNCLLVGGTSEHIQLVAKVIEELDASPAEDRQTIVYRLRNAQAPDIEVAIRQFLDQERQRVGQVLGVGSLGAAKELLAREVAVVAEKTGNTLLISGSPRYFETITAIVRELDQPPPQVLINVMLAEVVLDDNTEFGVQWNLLTHPTGDIAIGAKSDVGLTPTAFNFTVNSGDFSLLLRALQSQGRIEVLSRPQITAADNQTATINIGQRVPFVTNSRITDTGSVFNTIEYQPVGTMLTVTPRISPDGYVRLTVAPEISSMSNSTVKISNDVNAIVIDTREAKTTVTVQDNHSVVIGGLITNRDQHTEVKVPILGDIPLIGLAFKSTVVHKVRTELLIILTPRVIRNVTDNDVITNQQLRQVNVLGQTQGSIGIRELLNPLRGVSANEVERLENTGLERQSGYQPIVIPLRPRQSSGQGELQQQPSGECPRPQ